MRRGEVRSGSVRGCRLHGLDRLPGGGDGALRLALDGLQGVLAHEGQDARDEEQDAGDDQVARPQGQELGDGDRDIQLVKSLVQRIEVSADKRIRIIFGFRDVFAEVEKESAET